jgi:peptidoglycan/xylan/chitin deacetylase (PgdA/CDA1 family)
VELLKPVQRVLLSALTVPAATRLFSRFMTGRATIFVLHRLEDGDRGTPGHDLQSLRSFLSLLRRERYALVGLEELFRSLAEGDRRVSRAVAFTLDDGYADQGVIASRVFAEFDCPATVFVTTGFLDGSLWLWWDRIEYVLRRTARPTLDLGLGRTVLHYHRDNEVGYGRVQYDFTERCKHVSEEEKETAILRLAVVAEVDLPECPPPDYAPMSWADVRACEERGLTFGPHSVTHPVLAQTTDPQSRREITESWERLAAEARAPVPVFCYPSGQPWEYGLRELATLRQLGLVGAVGSTHGYVDGLALERNPDARFAVPRFGYPDDLGAAMQYVSGLERLKELWRKRDARSTEPGQGPQHGS